MEDILKMKMMLNGKVNDQNLYIINEKAKKKDEDEVYQAIAMTPLFDRIMVMALSLILGCLGVDRFYLGDIKLGVVKMLSFVGSLLMVIVPTVIITGLAVSGIVDEAPYLINTVVIIVGSLLLSLVATLCLVDAFFCYRKCLKINNDRIMNALDALVDVA